MPFTIRPYRRFLPLVYCSAVWSLITVLVLSSGPAYGEWLMVITPATEGATVYTDPSTIRRTGNLVKMWALVDYKTERSVASASALSSVIQAEYDCAEKRMRQFMFMEFSDHMGRGKMVVRTAGEERWKPVRPGTPEYLLRTVACKKQ